MPPKPEPEDGERAPKRLGSSLSAWRDIQQLIEFPRAQLWILAVLGAAVGLAETAFLAIIASVGVALAGNKEVAIKLPLFPDVKNISVPQLLGIGAVSAALTLGAQLLIVVRVARNETRTTRMLRIEAYKDFVTTSWATQRGEVDGLFLSYIANFIPRVSGVLTSITMELTAFITLLVFLAGAVVISPAIALVVIALGSVLFAVFLPARGMARGAGREATLATRKLYASFVNAINASREIKTYGVEGPVRERIDSEIRDLERPTYKARLLGLVVPAIYVRAVFLVMLGGLALIYAIGVKELTALGASLLLVLRAMQRPS